MDITDEMLNAAVRKAIEAGLLPRNAHRDDATGSKELMRTIVVAAMTATSQDAFHTAKPYGRHSTAPDVQRTRAAYAYS